MRSKNPITKYGRNLPTISSGVFIGVDINCSIVPRSHSLATVVEVSKADMIIVGDAISKAKLKNLMGTLEAEIGKEISFVMMTMDEFKYRLNMLDKLILDFLEGPHEEVINKMPWLKHFMATRK